MKHFLKCWPEYFQEVKAGRKLFEIRVNDRGYKVGDTLCLDEYDPAGKVYTGDKIDNLEVTYLLDMNQLPGQTRRYSQNMVCMSLRQMRTEPDCSTAEWQGGYCLGYGKSDTDDEPCEGCKACPKQASYDDDKCEWCDKVLTLFTHSGKYIPENQPPRNYCPNCGRHIGGE